MLLLLKLHGAHPADSLFTFNALLLACLEDLFVLDSESPTLDVEAVEGGDDGICIGGVAEVCKSEATKSTCLVEMIVEGIGKGDAQRLLEDRMRKRKKREKKGQTMIERRVSRETLKGIFLMTMAVGMISSTSAEYAGSAGIGGEPADERSDEDSGELSSHCCRGGLSGVSGGRKQTHRRQRSTHT